MPFAALSRMSASSFWPKMTFGFEPTPLRSGDAARSAAAARHSILLDRQADEFADAVPVEKQKHIAIGGRLLRFLRRLLGGGHRLLIDRLDESPGSIPKVVAGLSFAI